MLKKLTMTYHHHKNFIGAEDAKKYLDILSTKVDWYPFPLSPKSRTVHHVSPETNHVVQLAVSAMIEQIELNFPVNCRGIFLNKYTDGDSYCPYHKDQYNCDVYTISLGEHRNLLIKKDERGAKSEKLELNSGDLYILPKILNDTHVHSVPKTKKTKDVRISVVFFGEKTN